MRRRPSRPIAGSVVVIAGATSGAGRATVEAFTERRARLVLVARPGPALDAVVADCRSRGAEAVAAPADVGDPAEVDGIVVTALDAFGRIDTWVHMAAMLLAGRLQDSPTEDVLRLIRTDVAGPALCSRAALRQFDAQGEGVLILTGSVLSIVPNPLVPAYTMGKFAIRGLAWALRTSYPRRSAVQVCTILPGPIDSPMFERAANHTGRRLRSIPPACAPERVAAAVVRRAERPRAVTVVGAAGRLVHLGTHVVPGFTGWAVARYSARLLLTGEPTPATSGAAFAPAPEQRMSGGWRHGVLRVRLGRALGRALARRTLGQPGM